jgi:hypothetical protein
MEQHPQEKISWKKLLVSLLFVLAFFVAFGTVRFAVQYVISSFSSANVTTGNQKGNAEDLKSRLNEILDLENKHEFEKIYDGYFSQESKSRLTKEAYISGANRYFEDGGIFHSEISINDVKINDGTGYIDRTRVDCLDENCTNKKQTRNYKKFVYADNNWLMVVDDKITYYCVRNIGYEMPEEFKRALSLIIQRYSQSNDASLKENGLAIEEVQNCLNIQYAKKTDDLSDAEGMFAFTPSQSLEKLDIIVSPKYAAKDDLLTSVLLMHEITHVFDFINGQSHGSPVGCYESEANAFSNQNFFIGHVLNKEETRSIVWRSDASGSEEARQIIYVSNAISKAKGGDYHEKALNFVKASPAYQKQCKDRQ